MATTFTGLRVQDTYNAILKIGDNTNLTGTAKLLSDGLGNASAVYLSTTRLGIGVTPTYQFQTSANAKIGGNLIIAGDLTVNGTTTIIDSTIIAIGDNMIEMAKGNTANTKDIGWYGKIVSTGTKYVGMAYDASTGIATPKFNLGFGTVEPGNTFATTVTGTLVANLEGNVTGGTISGTTGTFTGLVSGIAPTSDLNFATKKYVDDQTIPTPTLSSVLSAGNTSGANDIKIIDDQKLLLGDDGDMQIYHNQVNSVFFNDTGNIVFRNNANDSDISFQTDDGQGYTTEYLRLDGDDVNVVFSKPISGTTASFSGLVTGIAPTSDLNFATKKYVDDQTIPTPTLSSVLGTGNTSGANNIIMADNQKILVGTDSDLELWFSSADGYLRNNTGDLYIQNLANDKSIVFQSDNGIGGVTEYFKIDGNINRNVILVTTQLNDNVPMIFGDGAGRPSIKYDSTASQLFINGDSKFLNSAYVVNNLNVQKSVYQTATGGFYISKPYGADFYTTQDNYTGAIEIALPTGGTGHDDMIKFVVDIFDYRTQESVTVFVGGYTYQNVGSGNTTWYYVSATVLGQSANQNYTVRFGDNGTEHCVWVGDTDSTWNHLQVIVRDFFAGYTADINNYLGAWDINVVTTQTTVNTTLTNCFPMSSDTITGYLPLTGGTVTGNVLLGSNTNISMDASANGQLMIDGVGYQGAIALDENAMHIYHNSSGRSLVLGTNETARLTIDGGGSSSTFSTTYLTVGGEGYIRGDDSGYLHFQGGTSGTRFYNNSNNVANFTILDDGTATFSGNLTSASLSAASIGITGTNGTDGKGISLYGGASSGEPTYGMMFQQTSSYGTMGYVTQDWATYFTMNTSSNRGWIFRKVGVGNVASINNDGKATFGTPSKFYTNDSELFIEDAGTNAVQIKTGAGDELYIGGNNTWQFRGTTTGQAQLNSAGYFNVTSGASNYAGIEMYQTDGSRIGFFYGDSGQTSTPNIGILDSDGNWAVRCRRDISVDLIVNDVQKFNVTTAINYNYQPTWIEGGSANWNETTPGQTTGSLHLNPGSSTDNFGSAITFGASDHSSGTVADAGIYTRSDGSYGTKMYFATTDSYAAGSKTSMMIDYTGNVGVNTTTPLSKFVVSEGTNQHGIELAPGTLSYIQAYDRATSTYGNMTIDTYHLRFGLNNGGEKIRFTEYGQILINAQSSGYGSNNYGYNLGVRGNSSQAYISIARDTQTLDTQGVIIGLDTNHSYFINRDALPIELHTNNTVRMHIHGSLNRVGIGGDAVSSAGVNNFLMVKGSSHSGIVLVDTDSGAVHEMWNDGGTLNMWDSSVGYRIRFYTNGNAQAYNGWTADSLGITGSNGTDGKGLSLYAGSASGEPTYGMMFMQTATFGGYGLVNGSWATYFTMNSDTSRGWIFRRAGNSNCASITAGGDLSLKGIISFPDTNMRLLGTSSSYLRIKSGSASDSGIEMQDTSGNVLGYFYGNTNQMGMYNKEGYNLFKATTGGSGITTIYRGDGITKIEAGDNVNIYHNTGNSQFSSNGYFFAQSWINLAAGTGIYTSTNGGHFYGNTSGTYGAWRTSGSRNGYSGIYDNHSATNVNMMDSSGNGGNYHSTAGWHFYYNRTNLCLAIGSSTTSSSYSLYVTGSIYSTADVIAYSDKRAKENIVTVDSAIEKVNKLRGVYYTPKEGDDKSRKVGVIAQEILEVLPEVVTHDKENDRYGVDYGKITGLLIEAIKDQQKQIDKLTKFVDKLNK